MPYLTVYTNVDFEHGDKLAEETAVLAAELLHKPVGYVVTNFIYNKAMSFGGSAENKGALLELKSIGLGDKDNFVAQMTAFLQNKLSIKNTKYICMTLTDSPATYTACAGQTFA